MYYIKKIAIFSTLIALLTACIDKPVVSALHQRNDENMHCQELQASLADIKRQKANIRKDDEFQFKYMLVVPTIIAAYQWDQAEKAANQRIEKLNGLLNRKGC